MPIDKIESGRFYFIEFIVDNSDIKEHYFVYLTVAH